MDHHDILAKFRRGNCSQLFKTDQSPKICPLEDFVSSLESDFKSLVF